MTTVLSKKGQITLPASVRRELHLRPGDHFEVCIEDDDAIMLRHNPKPARRGLVDLLLACPAPFEIPARDANDSAPPAL
jgi:AbrB family looped-hinge helix DNA binding protein